MASYPQDNNNLIGVRMGVLIAYEIVVQLSPGAHNMSPETILMIQSITSINFC